MMTHNILIRFPPELIDDLDAEIRRKYAPFKPPPRNGVVVQIVAEYVEILRLKNDQEGRLREP